jgi:hypothetical protein
MDLRNVIGMLLLAIGLLLIAAGITVSPRIKTDLFGLNLNLAWGIVLSLSGGFFVFVSKQKK